MIRTLLSAAALAALSAIPAAAEMMAHDAYARSANGKTGAAFMEIMNKGASDDVLIAARADVSRKVELHTHLFEGGVARMRQVEGGIPVPAGETVKLQRGGLHVMFMGLTAPMNSGESFPLTLVFQSGEEVQVDVTVDNERKPGHGGMHGHGAGHGKMKHAQ